MEPTDRCDDAVAATASPAGPVPRQRRPKILHVDDEPVWRMAVGSFFRLAGYQLSIATSGTEAMDHAGDSDLGLVILDVNLAGEDTAQLMSFLKTNHPQAAIILYTGLDREDKAVQRLVQLGAARYLRKGNLRELLKLIQDLSSNASDTSP
jgi:two-component system chemotaxis sensor kinase CheA